MHTSRHSCTRYDIPKLLTLYDLNDKIVNIDSQKLYGMKIKIYDLCNPKLKFIKFNDSKCEYIEETIFFSSTLQISYNIHQLQPFFQTTHEERKFTFNFNVTDDVLAVMNMYIEEHGVCQIVASYINEEVTVCKLPNCTNEYCIVFRYTSFCFNKYDYCLQFYNSDSMKDLFDELLYITPMFSADMSRMINKTLSKYNMLGIFNAILDYEWIVGPVGAYERFKIENINYKCQIDHPDTINMKMLTGETLKLHILNMELIKYMIEVLYRVFGYD